MSSKHITASRVIAVFALATLSLATRAEAQPYGPGQGGDNMMGGGWSWGMGGIGGIGFVVIILLFVGFAFYAVRHRNS
jgi:uncharacterized membrane protein